MGSAPVLGVQRLQIDGNFGWHALFSFLQARLVAALVVEVFEGATHWGLDPEGLALVLDSRAPALHQLVEFNSHPEIYDQILIVYMLLSF